MKTINEEIQLMIDRSLGQQPTLQLATIKKTYSDGHADVETVNGDLSYVKCIGNGAVGDDVILAYINNDVTQPVLIAR